jgi:p-aminobenzoyl-glutamate transporter AbgT
LNLNVSLDTLFIAVIVLAVLILIMIITFVVSVKPALKNQSGNVAYNNSANNITNQIAGSETDLVSDNELVAVITAAIYASMGDAVPEGGLVVRSIRRANSPSWKKA